MLAEVTSEYISSMLSFVTNTYCNVVFGEQAYKKLCPNDTCTASAQSKVRMITDMIRSYGSEFECLSLEGLPDDPSLPALGEAIRDSGRINDLSLFGDCDKNKATNPAIARMISAALGGAIKSLDVDMVGFGREEATVFAEALGNARELTKVSLFSLTIDAAALEVVCSGLHRVPRLETLDLSYVSVGSKTFADNFPPHLTEFSIRGSREGTMDGKVLASAIAKHGPQLKSVVIGCKAIDEPGIAAIADAILVRAGRGPTALRSLNLDQCDLTCCDHVAKLVERSPDLKKLSLYSNNIGKAAGIQLGKSLPRCAKILRDLDLAGCSIGDEGVAAICSALCGSKSLRFLRLRENHVAAAGAGEIAEKLLPNPCAMENLVLGQNDIDEAGAEKLAQGLGQNGSLRFLDVSVNPIGAKGAMAVIDSLCGPAMILSVGMHNTNMGDPGAVALARLISRSGIRHIWAAQNGISIVGLRAIAAAVAATKGYCSIVELDLQNNQAMGKEGAEAVAEILAGSGKALESLEIRGIKLGDEGASLLAERIRKIDWTGRTMKIVLRKTDCGGKGKDELISLRKSCGTDYLRMVIK